MNMFSSRDLTSNLIFPKKIKPIELSGHYVELNAGRCRHLKIDKSAGEAGPPERERRAKSGQDIREPGAAACNAGS